MAMMAKITLSQKKMKVILTSALIRANVLCARAVYGHVKKHKVRLRLLSLDVALIVKCLRVLQTLWILNACRAVPVCRLAQRLP